MRQKQVIHYQNPAHAAPRFTENLKPGTWFGFAEVDIKIPKQLWMRLEEIPLFFFTKQIQDEAVPQHFKDYCERTGRTRGDKKKLVVALSAALVSGTWCSRTIDNQATKIFGALEL